jgi:hypothetical protein
LSKSDTVSPLSTLKESYLPRLGAAKLGRLRGLNRSISIKTALDNEDAAPDTPRVRGETVSLSAAYSAVFLYDRWVGSRSAS